jgi:hypothetical protein
VPPSVIVAGVGRANWISSSLPVPFASWIAARRVQVFPAVVQVPSFTGPLAAWSPLLSTGKIAAPALGGPASTIAAAQIGGRKRLSRSRAVDLKTLRRSRIDYASP